MTRPSRLTFSVLCVGVMLTAWNAWLWFQELTTNPFANDFLAYFPAARIGLQAGWSRLYDTGLQQQFEYAAGSHGWEPYVNPPPLAWLIVPLTPLDFRTADLVWGACLVAAITAAALALAPAGAFRRAASLAAVLGWFPTGFALLLGQAAVLVASGVGLSTWLLLRRRDVLAGIALSSLSLKPQDAILLPFALLVAGRVRVFGAWAVATAVLAGISALELGPEGLRQALALVGLDETAPLNHRFALEGALGKGPEVIVVHVLLGALALFGAWRRRNSPEAVVGIGLVGSFLIVPHLSLQDFSVIAVAALLLLRSTPGLPVRVALAAGFVAGEFAIPLGPVPLLLALVALLAAGFHHDQDGWAQEDDPDRRKDAADHREHHLE